VPAQRESTRSVSPHPDEGVLLGRPLDDGRILSRIGPFVVAGLLAIVGAVVFGHVRDSGHLLLGAALIPVLIAAVLWLPWRRMHTYFQLLPMIVGLAAIALLRDATGGSHSILSALILLPVVWVAFYGTRSEVVIVLAAVAATLAIPPIIEGPPVYSAKTAILSACLWVVVGIGVAVAARRLMSDVRRLAFGYRSILDTAQDAFVAMDGEGRIIEWNRAAEQIFGWRRTQVAGRVLDEVIIPMRLRKAHRQGLRRFLVSGETYMVGARRQVPALHHDGHELMVELSLSAEPAGDSYAFYAFIHDVSTRTESELALREAEERFRSAFDDAAVGMAIVSPEGRWLRVNQALAELTGYSAARLTRMGFADITHPEDLGRDLEALNDLVSGERRRFVTEKRYRHADGHTVWVSLSVSTVRGEHGELLYLISQMQDISERKAAEARLAHQALHDPLTGLPNRTLFGDRMLVARARIRRGGSLAVLFCDLDRFKDVNDRFGHDMGDRVLADVAGRMSAVVRPSDTIARIGGDEFAILCEGIDERGATVVADRVASALDAPVRVGDGEQRMSASIGIVLTEDADREPEALLGAADAAMYRAKRAGGARYVIAGESNADDAWALDEA
jgi:diguanylate cyclase (GGDEF)-like protein/PAS domain S-box-containing protein